MSLFNELKRRNVFRVGLAYLVGAWVIAQVADLVLDNIDAPPWVMQALLLFLGLGFIVAIIISWAYELTADGLKKDSEVTRDESIANHTGKKLDYITLAGVLLVVGLFTYQQMNPVSPSVIPAQAGIQSGDTNSDSRLRGNDENGAGNDEKGAGNDGIGTRNDVIAETDNKSIAVLPFANMANNAENEPFTLGLHDDLLTHLSKISALKVISRTSVMEYKDTTKKIKDIAKELGVANILEGGVQRSGNQIRLNVQLIDAATDDHIWAEIYDEELTTANIFSIQTKISKQIAAALKAQLSPVESKSIETAPTDNLAAYDAYLAARQLIEKREPDSLKQALALFQKATELDSNYALAYIGQATALALLNAYSDLSNADMLSQGEPLIIKALNIDPLLAEAHVIKGTYLNDQKKYAEAEASFKLALNLNPNLAEVYHFYGAMLRDSLGRNKESIKQHLNAVELNPLSNVMLANLGWAYRANGDKQESLKQFEKLHRLNPNFSAAFEGIAWLNDDQGDYAQAIINQSKSIELVPGRIIIRMWRAYHYMSIGDIVAVQNEMVMAKKIAPEHFSYLLIKPLLNMLKGDYQAAQQGFISMLEKNQDSRYLKEELARFSVLNSDCETAISMWQSAAPELFEENYSLKNNNLFDKIDLAWCLKKSGQSEIADRLLSKVQNTQSENSGSVYPRLFTTVGVLAVQGKAKEAAQAYANQITSKRSRGWFWIDHIPYFAEMRKEPVFIKAREELTKNLAEQRDLLKQLQAKEASQ